MMTTRAGPTFSTFNPRSKTPEQCQTELADGRTKLVGREAAVPEIAAWRRENVATSATASATVKADHEP